MVGEASFAAAVLKSSVSDTLSLYKTNGERVF